LRFSGTGVPWWLVFAPLSFLLFVFEMPKQHTTLRLVLKFSTPTPLITSSVHTFYGPSIPAKASIFWVEAFAPRPPLLLM